MNVCDIKDAVRAKAGVALWSAGVTLARTDRVIYENKTNEELSFSIAIPGGVALKVFLWPEESDWGCDCGHDVCLHVVAAAIVSSNGDPVPKAAKRSGASVVYTLKRLRGDVRLDRAVLRGEKLVPITTGIRNISGVHLAEADLVVEEVLQLGNTRLPSAGWNRILKQWYADESKVMLDNEYVKVSGKPVGEVVRVNDCEEGFRVTLHKASKKAEHLGGIVLAGDTIHPKGKSPLSLHERSSLVRGITFVRGQEGRLVGELLPRLRKRLDVEICTDKLPEDVVKMPPRLIANVQSGGGILEVTVEIVYGDPICGRVRGDNMIQEGDIVPIRDPAAEYTLIKQAASTVRLSLGRTWRFEGLEGAKIVKDHLSRFRGEIIGDVGAFDVREKSAKLDIKYDSSGGAYIEGEVGHDVALQAWRDGESLVPLLGGGWAPLPPELTGEHAALFADLLSQASDDGVLPRFTAVAVGQIAQALDNPLPPGFKKLAPLLKGFKGLPKTALPKVFTAELRPYQLIGYRWLRFLAKAGLGGVLADDMGLGKTIQTLCALVGIGGRSLVVAPTSVVRNWASEIDKFTDDVNVCVYHGQSRKLDPKAKIVITSYALLRLDPKIVDTEWRTVVLDEAQAIKNPESQTAQAAFALKAEHRFTLTGTPIENSLDELWAQLHFVMPGFLGGRTSFREEISRPMEQGDQKAAALLRSKIGPFVLRRLKEDVAPELPSLTEMRVMCHLTETQRSIYDAVMSAAKMELKTEEGSRTMKVLEHLLRLRQAACHPRLLPGDRPDESGKLQVLIEKLHSVVAGDHKALVFSQWTGFLDLIQEELERCGINYVRLDGSTRDRESVVAQFQSDDGPPVFLISLKAGGTGINLTAADYVFITDPWWNPAVEAQATDRAHRIGQQRPVVAIRMIAEGTVEERIASLQEAKKELAEAALGGEEAFTGRLTRNELMGLFRG